MPSGRGVLFWSVGAILGAFTGFVQVAVGDSLLTALLALMFTMVLGVIRPDRPWRWTLLIAIFTPIAELVAWLADLRPYRSQILGAFLTVLPAIVGAYGGHFMRLMINNILAPPPPPSDIPHS